MISRISLHTVLPTVFSPRAESDVWGRELELERGKSYLIEADSGTGKSTLLGILYGYRHEYNGRVLFDDADIRAFSPDRWVSLRQQELAILFQELRLFPTLTARENIEVKNQLTGLRSGQWVETMFERLDIADKTDTPVRFLSWGQQQRVAFIRALCQPCTFLLLDEPVSHLDDNNARTMSDILREDQQQRGYGMLSTSVGKRLPYSYDSEFCL
jgi:ABC-type lipoprotein export system ATPase subunit